MSKALLQREVEKAIAANAARRASEEKPAVVVPNTLAVPPIPNSSPAPNTAPLPVYVPLPAQIQQVIVYPPQDNTALVKEKAAKEKVQELYEAEKVGRAQSQQQHQEELERIKQVTKEQLEAEQQTRLKAEELQQEELERNQQLVKEDDSLKRRHSIALEKNKADEETIQRIIAENEMLKQELERLKKANEESKLASEAVAKEQENESVKPVPVPPPYDDADKPEPVELAAHNNEVSLTGEVTPESPIEESSDKCAIS